MSDEHLTTVERALAMPLRSVIVGPELHEALTALVADARVARDAIENVTVQRDMAMMDVERLDSCLPPRETQEWACRQGEVGVDADDDVTPPGCPPMLTLVGNHGIIASVMGEAEAQHVANAINAAAANLRSLAGERKNP
jgi:hypothetical protein